MTLEEWARLACAELGMDDRLVKSDVDRILDLARDAAHSIARPAAPLTTYLLGLAVGRGADPDIVASHLSALAQSHASEQPPAD